MMLLFTVIIIVYMLSERLSCNVFSGSIVHYDNVNQLKYRSTLFVFTHRSTYCKSTQRVHTPTSSEEESVITFSLWTTNVLFIVPRNIITYVQWVTKIRTMINFKGLTVVDYRTRKNLIWGPCMIEHFKNH